MTDTILDKIKAYKLEEIAARKAAVSLAEVEAAARAASPLRGFASRLKEAAQTGYALIAEVKKGLALERPHSCRFRSARTGPCL